MAHDAGKRRFPDCASEDDGAPRFSGIVEPVVMKEAPLCGESRSATPCAMSARIEAEIRDFLAAADDED